MKSHPLLALIISIIFSLIAFMSPIEGHTVWIHNKLEWGTWAGVDAITEDGKKITSNWSISHKGFHLTIPDDTSSYYLHFGLISFEEELFDISKRIHLLIFFDRII
ncbi:hypothetical protein RhiirA5_387576 [Rhizophagus irregularis]|uniref:Uncharacterized protein n=1 Tax=Rhizophagus irregularis TaxID=588596 RepID=A0A2N0NDV8_9GLOM|nr:hypothetical protein RhiirA5_387576 [Rhizophagus irregularis]